MKDFIVRQNKQLLEIWAHGKEREAHFLLQEALIMLPLQIALFSKTNIIPHVQPTLPCFCLEGNDVFIWLSGKFVDYSDSGNAILENAFL